MTMTKIMAVVIALSGVKATGPGMRYSHSALGLRILKGKTAQRRVDTIIIHCSATKAGIDFGATDIDRWHREQGMNGIGYHYVVRLDGRIEKGREVSLPGAHCIGWNGRSIGICYIGGLDAAGHPADTRTDVQKSSLRGLIEELKAEYAIDQVMGHRDTSPDLNGNGVIEPNEFVKACPCFDVRAWLLLMLTALLLTACGSHRGEVTKKVQHDSMTMIDRNNRADTRLQTEQHAYEEVNEYIEQWIFALQKEDADSVKRNSDRNGLPTSLVSITQKLTNRHSGSQLLRQSDSSANSTDSLRTIGQWSATQEQRQEQPDGWRWYKVVLGGGCLLVGGWAVWRKIKALVR